MKRVDKQSVKRFFSEKEAAFYLGISVSMIRNLRSMAEIEYRVFGTGKKIIYDIDSLDEAARKDREISQLHNLNKLDDEEDLLSWREMPSEEYQALRKKEDAELHNKAMASILAETKLYETAKSLAPYNEDLHAAVTLYEQHCLDPKP